jgi:hypothetical protein
MRKEMLMAAHPNSEVLVVAGSELANARSLAAEHGVSIEPVPDRGIEPVTTVTLLLIGPAVAVGAVRQALDQRRGGQVIDLRPGAPASFYRTTDLAYGLIVVIAVDGKVTLRSSDTSNVLDKVISALPMLTAGNNGGAKQAAKVLARALGSDAEVTMTTEAAAESE